MEDIVYSLTKSESDIKKAFFLVRKVYIKQGYLKSHNSAQKIKILGPSVTFVAKYNKRIIGTVSVIFDSKSGLPMDETYNKELDIFRAQNKKIIEVGRLAIDRDFLLNEPGFKKYNGLFVMLSLFKLVFHYCIYKNFDNICISINPKHNLFYKSMLFMDIGGLRPYPSMSGAPAMAKTLDINKIKNKKSKSYLINKLFWQNPPDYKIFEL